MKTDGLQLPARLVSLVEARIWPRTARDTLCQHDQPRVSKDRVHSISAHDDQIWLFSYDALCSLAREIEGYEAYYRRESLPARVSFWRTRGDLEKINPELAISIGDFGLGSDSPIVLEYRTSLAEPAVLRLAWAGDSIEHTPAGHVQHRSRTSWTVCAATFDEFVERTGLAAAAPLRPLA